MRGIFSLWTYFGGLAVLFVAERIFGVGSPLHLPLASVAGILLCAAVGMRLKQWSAASGETRKVLRHILPGYLCGFVGTVLYAASAEGSPVGLEAGSDLEIQLKLLSLLLILCGSAPILLSEFSLFSMYGAPRLETRRLQESGRSGLAAALAFALVVTLNFVANDRDERFDLRSVRDLDPSPTTVEMVRNLSEPLELTLFFPAANDVYEQVQPYFAQLDAVSEHFTVTQLDRDMHPDKARKVRARKNGTIVISQDTQHESLTLDTDPDKARRKLKKFDEDFQKALAKVSRDERIAYFVVGHGERSTSPRQDEPSGLKKLKDGLSRMNYKTKKLGIREGLSEQVPDDATVVFLVGPQGSLLETEEESLIRYVQEGGSLYLAVDPDVDEVPELGRLLATLGLEARYEPILSERSHASLKRALSDRRYLASNRFTSHDSLSTLSKRSSRDHVLFDTTGWLSKAKETAEGASEAKVTFIIKAPSGSWNDVNGDYEFDKDVENKKAYNLIAAVELAQPEGSEMPGGKAIVSADADVIGDFWLPISRGNAQLAIDTVRWLEGETELAAEVAAIEDVKIVHTKDEDKLWFYSTTLGMPILLLALGAGLNRSRRRRMES